MKQYVIDQLRESDHEQIKEYLDNKTERTALQGVYWVEVPSNMATAIQGEHTDCQPHYFAINLDYHQVSFELLIRSKQIIRCKCIAYATAKQRDFILQFADKMLEELGISV
jgi:hypothetical protein